MIFLGRIPHGFHEEQMKSYFAQFGDVTRLRLSRNKKVCRLPTTLTPPSTDSEPFYSLDGTFETLRFHRIRFRSCRRDRRGDNGQLSSYGPHSQMQSRTEI